MVLYSEDPREVGDDGSGALEGVLGQPGVDILCLLCVCFGEGAHIWKIKSLVRMECSSAAGG